MRKLSPKRAARMDAGTPAAKGDASKAPPALSPLTVSRFIPLTRQAVIADLCQDITGAKDTVAFARLGVRLERHRARGYDLLARELRDLYLPFSPDADTLNVDTYDDADRQAMQQRLSRLTAHLLDRANYTRLPNADITAILSAQSPYALRIAVDLAEYDLLHVYWRDTYVKRYSVRRPERAYLMKAHFEVRVFRRLFVLLKLKSDEDRAKEVAEADDISVRKALKRVRGRRRQLPEGTAASNIYVKVFKDMPQHDLQILFPLRKVQFRPFDKLKLMATAGGGTLVGVVSTTGKILAATNPLAAAGALIGFAGLLGRQVTTFFNQRTRYMVELSQKLFFHNLASNRAAITLILDRAEEEDVKEDLITMFFNAGESVEQRELAGRKRAIDEMLANRYGIAVDFELDDALSRLTADGIVTRDGDTYRFATFDEAAKRYEELHLAGDEDEARHLAEATAEEIDPAAGAVLARADGQR